MRKKYGIVSFLLLVTLFGGSAEACQGGANTAGMTADSTGQVSINDESKSDEPSFKDQIFTDPRDVTIMLQEMARIRKNVWTQNESWWHGQKKIESQSGNLHGAAGEWWFRFKEMQSCPEMMQIIYQEDGQVQEASIMIPESSLKEAKNPSEMPGIPEQIDWVKVPDESCPDLLNLTLNHVEQVLKNSDEGTFESVEANIRDGYLLITLTQKDFIVDELTITIDLETGMLTGEKNQIFIPDQNKLEGEVEYRYDYEKVDHLPMDIENQFNPAIGQG